MELDEVADDRDEILTGENSLTRRTIGAEPLIDLVTADASEVVALRREEETLQRLLRSLAIGRVTRAKKRVDLTQRFLFRVSRILCKCVLDQRRLGAARSHEDLNLVDLGLAQLLDQSV